MPAAANGMKILLVGFFGEGNLGDEAIRQGISSCLPDSARFLVTSGRTMHDPSVERLPRRGLLSWPRFLLALREADHVVFSGGIFQDWSFEGLTFFGLRLIAARLLGHNRPSFWGVGLGPLRRHSTRSFAARLLKHPEPICVRDPDSLNLLRELSGRTGNLGADWSWGVPDPHSDRSRQESAAIGLNLRPWATQQWRNLAISHFNPLPTSHFCGVSARPEDTRLLQREFPSLSVHEPDNFSQLIQICRQFPEGWAMRFHVLLAMLRADIKVVPLPYDQKVRTLCMEAGLPLPSDERRVSNPRKAAPTFTSRMQSRYFHMQKAFTNLLTGSRTC